VAHTGIIQFPMRKGWKRVHRLVVLPDFQGIGIGTRFINEVTKNYIENGFNMNLTTTTPALVHALAKDNNWALVRKGRSKSTYKDFNKYGKGVTKMQNTKTAANSQNRITYSFNWKK
jgi:GNAT superfamily N-acetyltransferase